MLKGTLAVKKKDGGGGGIEGENNKGMRASHQLSRGMSFGDKYFTVEYKERL